MYPSKGSNPYGQQPYGAQQAYGQMPGSAYSVSGMDSGPQHALASRQSSMMGLGSAQESDISGYRSHPSQASQYGGPYANIYGSSSLSSAQQVAGVSGKGPISTSLTGRTTYPSALPEPSKFSSGALGSSLGMTNDDFVSASNRGFSQKAEQYSSLTNMDYASLDRRNYGENQGSYTGRDFQSDTGRRYPDSVSLSHQHQSEFHDHMDQTSLLRQQQILKAQSLQSGSDMRQADYFAARAAPTHHGSQDTSSYGGRLDADPRSLSILGSAPYGGQHAASLLGGAPRRNVDDLVYAQGSSSASYGVGLPPGRDYGAGKGLHGPTIESNYQGSVMSRGHPGFGVSMDDERKDDRTAYRRELEIRDEERRRELMREREKEREREERQRERERERERERLRVRREKERERDRKRGPDSRRERTPPRATRERRGSSSIRDEKPLRRVSPRRDAVHRHHSPVKEKKREYICKVFPFRLVDVERDYLSLSKRYPKLTIASDFCKVIFNWPKERLSLSLHTPVSFEHGFVEAVEKADEKVVCSDGSLRAKGGDTVWNAKVILLSGASIDALDGLCSEKSTSERIMHFNNILKFAVLRKDRSFMAIGGPWNVAIDGGDPLANDSCLIQTAVRHVKDLTQLDLHNCQHWNRFLELHYDRVGKDGLFSHREITVLFLPDLSECLPSIELWRSQWLAHKKEMAEREQRQTMKHEKKPGESKDTLRGDQSHNKTLKADSVKSYKSDDNIVKVDKISPNTDDLDKCGTNGSNENAAEHEGRRPSLDEKQTELKNEEFVDSGGKTNEIIVQDDTPVDPAIENKRPMKKKIVKKVVKGKVVRKKETTETAEEAIAKNELMEAKEGDKHGKEEEATQEDHNSTISLSVRTFVRKKIVKKVPVNKSAQEDKSVKAKAENEPEEMDVQHDKWKVEKEQDGSSILQESGGKMIGKKKVIRRVIKRKVSSKEKDFNAANDIDEANKEGLKDHVEKKDEDTISSRSPQNKITESKEMPLEKDNSVEKKMKEEKGDTKESVSSNDNLKAVKGGSKGSNEELPNPKDTKKDVQDDMGRIDEKVKRSTEEKLEPKQSSHKEVKGKTKAEEPPKHPGLVLQTKRSNETKIRSVTLSLDALLDYNDKDIEESTFELSIFAESFNEMLQYQMGCRLLAFLERLRKRYLIRRNQRKRERDEKSEKGNEKVSEKRLKTNGCPTEDISVKIEKEDVSNKSTGESAGVDDSAYTSDEPKLENKTEDEIEYEDDPEEIIEDQDMDAAAASNDGDQEDMNEDKSAILVEQPEKMTVEDDKEEKVANLLPKNQTVELDEKSDAQDKQAASEKRDSVKEDVVDKELFQAFRYFDRNRVGYIKVEDLRCIIHNLGKFLCHRDVKEMVQSALFESNSARDDRIFYKKLVSLVDI
ncbi:protein SHORT ROOT IN SALT MEDIUM 1 isoform X1 [Typha latifolia]|uniref:protein SHORT ROOT IN SALT MEDIUM 1 isoform X1 n=2 Tax=Typha latifolia TaxID=4733 RepID=UPI003C2DBABB